ncbi:unnamed protein product, partial [marine sediment metagenome]
AQLQKNKELARGKISEHQSVTRIGAMTPRTPLTAVYDIDLIQRDRKVMQQRMARLWPKAGFQWRIERKPRLTGSYRNQIAPHYHIICTGIPGKEREVARIIRQMWWEVLKSGRPGMSIRTPQVKVIRVYSDRQMASYMAKYVSKKDNKMVSLWLEFCNIASLGRHWGSFGVRAETVFFSADITPEQYVAFKRIVLPKLKRSNKRYARRLRRQSPRLGLSIFGMGVLKEGCRVDLLDSFAYQALVYVLMPG